MSGPGAWLQCRVAAGCACRAPPGVKMRAQISLNWRPAVASEELLNASAEQKQTAPISWQSEPNLVICPPFVSSKQTFLKLQKLCGFVRIYFDQQVGKTVALILWRGQSPLDRDPAESCVIGAELCSGLFCMQPLLSPAAPAAKANFTTSICHGTELSVLG